MINNLLAFADVMKSIGGVVLAIVILLDIILQGSCWDLKLTSLPWDLALPFLKDGAKRRANSLRFAPFHWAAIAPLMGRTKWKMKKKMRVKKRRLRS